MPLTPVDVAALHPPHAPFALLGRLERRTLVWAGQLLCSVQTSVGHLTVRGNRDTLLDVEEGSWLALHLERDEDGVRVRSQHPASPLLPAAWLPSVSCSQPAVLERLRHLLGRLGPGAQALFMSAMSQGPTQRRFFERPAALDHHAEPGGLFQQSVLAAELAYRAWHPTETDRDAATVAALLFDIGKLADPWVLDDVPRERHDLEPHVLTRLRAGLACDAVEAHDPEVAQRVRALLVPGDDDPDTDIDTDTQPDPRLRQSVHLAVTRSWRGLGLYDL